MTDDSRQARRLRKAELAFHALGMNAGNPKEAATALGIAETTLRRRVGDYCRIKGFTTPFEAAYFSEPAQKRDDIGTVGSL